MSVYYKVIGHADNMDMEQEIQTFIFNEEQPTNYLFNCFKRNWYEKNLGEGEEEMPIYIDFIFKSYQPITDQN
jgi:hypothetical protein